MKRPASARLKRRGDKEKEGCCVRDFCLIPITKSDNTSNNRISEDHPTDTILNNKCTKEIISD
jgi:hypothetical protein